MTGGPGDEFDRVVAGERVPLATRVADGVRAANLAPATRLDAWWQRMMSDPRLSRAWTWGGPGLVTLIAAILRLQNLGTPHALVFDETYYVKDSWTLMHLGYEGSWPEGADQRFVSGDPDVYTDVPSFVAHPPLGKWIIAAGLAVFGAQDAVGWRISTAVVGILLVVLTMLIAKHLFGSTLGAVIAGGLLAIDGNAIVMSRVALLDNSVALLALLGAGALLLDRGLSERRMRRWMMARELAHRRTDWGPAMWWRPWLFAAGAAFGAASGVKWNGIYFLAIFAVYVVLSDALLRRRLGCEFWISGALLKQAPVNFLLLVPVALLVNLSTWTGWFVTGDGYYRHWAEQNHGAWTGLLARVPLPLQNWWHYQASMYSFHVNEHDPHSYQANPLTWLFLVRPTSMYYQDFGDGTAAAITEIANPLIWWSCTAALVFLVVRLVGTGSWRYGFILIGVAAGYLPWMLYLNRTVFQFYTIVFEPFSVIGLTAALLYFLGSASDPPRRRRIGIGLVGGFLVLCVALSVFWYPMWTGQPVPMWFLRAHYWLTTWI